MCSPIHASFLLGKLLGDSRVRLAQGIHIVVSLFVCLALLGDSNSEWLSIGFSETQT